MNRRIHARCPKRHFEHLESRRLLAGSHVYDNVDFAIGAMVADPVRNLAYVIDQTNAKVLAIDTALGRTVAHAPLAGAGTSIAVSPAGDRLYVADPGTFRIEFFTLPELKKTGEISTAISASQIVVDSQGRLYTSTIDAIHQIDAASGALLATVSTLRWSNKLIRTNAAGTRLYVREIGLSGIFGTCEEYDVSGTHGPALLAYYNIPMSNGRDFAVDTKARRIYTADGGVYGVGVTNMDTNERAVWGFVSAVYGGGVATREGSNSVFGLSTDPYGGGVFEFDKASGQLKNVYTSSYSAMAQSVVVTPGDDVVYGAAYWTGTYEGFRYRLGAVGPESLVVDDVPVSRFEVTQSDTDSFAFDASASAAYKAGQSITGYAWDFGDGQTFSGPAPSHRYTSVGTYTVRLTVTSSAGLTDDFSATVTVTEVGGPLAIDRLDASPGVYRSGDVVAFTVVLTKPVTVTGNQLPSLDVIVGNRRRTAVLAGGTGTSQLRFVMPVTKGDLDRDGVSIRGSIRIPRGTSMTGSDGSPLPLTPLATPSGVTIDTRPPFAVSLIGPAAGAYVTGHTLLFKVRFSEPVIVTRAPQFTVIIGRASRKATYVAAPEAAPNEAWFRYTVRADDFSRTGISVARTITLPSKATITNNRGEAARLALWLPWKFGSGVTVNA